MTLRNLRAYTQNKDDTLSTVTPSDYETGKGANARLRKINLNVDIATQAELNEAFNLLSNAIEDISTGTLSNYYTKPEVNDISTALSTALTGEIDAEATARKKADNAIKASLSAYALSTTVADAYKVTVVKDETPETSAYVATYHVEQNGTQVGASINIPKDYVVKDAALCTVTEAGVPYPEAQVDDKYIDFTVNTAESDDAKHIYLPVKDLVDVYTGGSTTFADVNVDNNRVITVNVSADTISAAAVAAVVGQDGDLSTANTIHGAKRYADEVAAAVAVSAEGETGEGALVSADDANNMITVGSTQKLKDAVAAAETAVQTVTGDNTYLTATRDGNAVSLDVTDKIKNVVTKVEAASADWDSAEADAKAYTNDVSAALSTTLHNELAAEASARSAADEFLSGKIDALSVSVNAASGDNYVNATVENNTVKVSATDLTKGAVDKVVAASATWDATLTSVAGGQTTYITVTASEKAANAQTISATAQTHTVTDAVAGTADGLAVASDVKGYVDDKITDLSVSAAGDAYVNATSTGKAITVTATDKLTAVVSKVEQTSATWDAAAPMSDLNAEVTRATGAEEALGTKIDNLSATYASKTTVDNAATTLEGAAAVAAKDLSAYNDIDEIITELEALKAAVKTFAGTLKTA